MSIKETYIKLPHEEEEDVHRQNVTACVRERKKHGLTLYNYEKRYVVGDERIQEMRTISAKDFVDYQKIRLETKQTLLKERTTFAYKT